MPYEYFLVPHEKLMGFVSNFFANKIPTIRSRQWDEYGRRIHAELKGSSHVVVMIQEVNIVISGTTVDRDKVIFGDYAKRGFSALDLGKVGKVNGSSSPIPSEAITPIDTSDNDHPVRTYPFVGVPISLDSLPKIRAGRGSQPS